MLNSQAKGWLLKAHMNSKRASHTMYCEFSKIYIVGGSSMMTPEVYDVALNQCTFLDITTPGLQMIRSAFIGHSGQIYMIGGRQEEGDRSDDIYVYTIAENKWHTMKTKLPSPRSSCCATIMVLPQWLYENKS